MNEYLKNLDRIEFLVTLACTGKCKHCSEGEHIAQKEHIDGDSAATAVKTLCGEYKIQSLMTFGGEPMLYFRDVCKIHAVAKEMNISKRQLITNGFFAKDKTVIEVAASELSKSGVNDILLSVDAFHQETIPLETVKLFAAAVLSAGIPVRSHPAWLIGKDAHNIYNDRTREILREFADMGIPSSDGNIVFPAGNALKYLSEYFNPNDLPANPYDEDPRDIHSVCFSPDGGVLGGNIRNDDIAAILAAYKPAD